MPPRSRFIEANRLRLHLLEWDAPGPLVLLAHGFLEHAHAWDFAGERLAARGYRVAALDWRGHGDSEWIGRGGYYHFADYTADLAAIVRHYDTRVALVGHSMGAAAVLTYAGTEPERVWAVVAVDALGPPDHPPGAAPDRFVHWLADLDRHAARPARTPFTLDDAVARIAERYPFLSSDIVRHLAEHGTRPVDDATPDRRVWKFDPLHQTTSPQPFYVAQASAFWRRISAPVLYVDGGDSPFQMDDAERDARLATLRARRITLPGVRHHPHLEDPDGLVSVLLPFLDRARPT